jgi:hypothetical protein
MVDALWATSLTAYQEHRLLTGAELAAVQHVVAPHLRVTAVEVGHVLDGSWGGG